MVKYLTKSNLGNLIGLAVAAYLLVSLVSVIKRNHDLQLQIGGLNSQLTQLQTQKDELSYEIRYYQSDSFKEKEARSKLGLEQPGENLIILPPHVSAGNAATPTPKAKAKSNPSQWLDFLFGN